MAARDFFLIPPFVPYSDASRAHWLRSEPQTGPARVLWIRILPMGAMFQFTRTENGVQGEIAPILLQNPQLAVITNFLFSVAQQVPLTNEVVTSSLLSLLLAMNDDDLRGNIVSSPPLSPTSDHLQTSSDTDTSLYRVPSEGSAAAIERARNHISANLIDPALSLPTIAHHSYISANQLERLFRSELQTSVMRYVTQRRLEEAKSLLTSTNIAVQEVASLCGYTHRTHFTRLFSQHVGMSPRQFRKQQRIAVSLQKPSD